MPAVSTLVTGTQHAPFFVDDLRDATRIAHQTLARAAGERAVLEYDPIEHDDTAWIADAAGIVRIARRQRSRRFSAGPDLRVLFDLPGTAGFLALHQRLHRIR